MNIDFNQDPFEALDSKDSEDTELIQILLNEFYTEVAPGHPLYGETVKFLARRIGTDDIILELEDGRIADVHLTWIKKPDRPPWPGAGIFKDKKEYWEIVMREEVECHKQYSKTQS